MLKISGLSIFAIAVLLGTAVAQQTPPPSAPSSATKSDKGAAPSQNGLTTQKEKFSYALGMNLGTNLQKQSVPVDVDLVMRGLKDSLAGGKLLLTEDEARAAMTEVQNQLRQQMQEKAKAQGEANQKEGDAFLAANKSKPDVVTLPSGLQYKILQPGTGPKPAATDTVVCNYKGTLVDGKEFDSSSKHGGPASFPVTGVIKGWTEALQLMPVGSKWQLFVPPSLGYGERGAGNDIGPDATLIFEVELVSIKPKTEGNKTEPKK
jgi:FKBP-type peptidyl-prolyl cis-trans isomerase FklB